MDQIEFLDDDLLDFEEEVNDEDIKTHETIGQDFGAELLLSEGKLTLDLAENDINYRSLAALNSEDLEILGIADARKRREILEEITYFPNQLAHFEGVVRGTDLNQYKENLLEEVRKHLLDLKTSVVAAHLKMQVCPPEDVLVEENTYSSELVLNVLEEISKNTEIMEDLLLELKEGKVKAEPEQKKTKFRKFVNTICIIGGVSATVFLIYSACKYRFPTKL